MDEMRWRLVRQERLSLAEMLEPLTPEQWTAPSLCTEWTVRDVVAHLVMTPAGEPRPWQLTRALARARGHLWSAGRDLAITYARRSPAELVSSLHDLAGSRVKPVFVVDDNLLLDLVVHGQDIAVPLGLDRPVPDDAARLVLDRTWRMGWPFHARRRLAGLRLSCVGEGDGSTIWQAGSGPEVRGPAAALALLMTGRTAAAVPMLRGPGAELLPAA